MEKSLLLHLNVKAIIMKTPKMTVHIPEPCHEDWNKMLPDEKGKFCLSCNKSVVDFTGKSDTEIHQILMENTGQKLCGRFTKTQLNRPLNIRVNLADLPKNMSSTHSFAIALFLVFGSLLFSCTDSYGQKMGKIQVIKPKPQSTMMMGEPAVKNLPPDSIKTEIDHTIKGDVVIEEPIMGKMIMPVHEIGPDSLIEKQEVKPDSVWENKEALIPEEMHIAGGLVAIEYHEDMEENQEELAQMLNDNSMYSDPEMDLTVSPNPSNGEMTFGYELKNQSSVSLRIYSEKGELLRTLVDMPDQHSGPYRIPANLSDLNPGMYFATLVQDGRRVTKRIVVAGR